MTQEITTTVATVSTPAEVSTFDYNTKIATLSQEDKVHYLEIASKIKMNDMSSISHYGAELSATVANNGNILLDAVRGNSNVEVVSLTNDLLAQLNAIDIDELNSGSGFKAFLRKIPILKRLVTSIENLSIKYETISEKVEKIAAKIGASKVVAMRDNGTLEAIYTNNTQYIKQLRELIMAAKLKDEEFSREIDDMVQHPELYDSHVINDAANFRNALQKRIADMVTTEYILQQNLFQIRATQSNNIAIADKSDAIVNHIIPIWKNQLAIAIIMNNQQANIDAQKRFADTTNQILTKNAQLLKTNSINVAKASNASIVDLNTLKSTTQDLIDTIVEVRKIHNEGVRERAALETTLQEYGKKLESALITESGRLLQ